MLTGMAPASAASQRHVLPGTVPQWAKPAAVRGNISDGVQLNLRVYLAGRDAAGLRAYAAAVSDPASALYHHYLSGAAAKARFGSTPAQISAVTGWLRSAGLQVTGVSQHYLTVHGSVASAERAFSTQLRDYRVGRSTLRAPSVPASVPADVSGAVLAVTGLDSASHRMKHADTLPGPAPAFVNAPPCSAYFGEKKATTLPTAFGKPAPYAVCGYTGRQLRGAYGVTGSGLTGRGVTVAITDAFASPTILNDANTYAVKHGDRAFRAGQFTQSLPAVFTHTGPPSDADPEGCDAQGWYGEETLDVEAVHNLAPSANVLYVGGASCLDDDLIDALSSVVDNRSADIVSNSWAGFESALTPELRDAYEQVFQQGAVEGIGFYFSSGDDGDELAASGTKQVLYPASDPWVTGVGGTSLAVGRGDTYQFETGWGTDRSGLSADGTSWTPAPPGDFLYGAGGGTSTLFDQPFYQRRVVPDALSKANGATAQRVVPDISAVGDPNTGMLVGQTQQFPDGTIKYSEYRLGGTSLAAPVIAGIQALAQQAQHGVPIGFANPSIYFRAGTAAYHDVTDHPLGQGVSIAEARVDYVNGVDASGGLRTSLRSFGHDSSLAATPGYDDVTGVGSPSAGYLCSFERQGRHR